MTPTTITTLPARAARYARRVVATLVGLLTILVVPGTAFARTDPGRSDSVGSGTATIGSPAVPHASTTDPVSTSSGWGLTTLGIVVVAALAVGLVVLARRIARRRRVLRTAPVSV